MKKKKKIINPYIDLEIKDEEPKEKEDDEVRECEYLDSDWPDLKNIYDLLQDTNRRYSGTLSAKVLIENSNPEFHITTNPDCIYNKIHDKIKTTFDLHFRKKAFHYALETYNEKLF